MIKGARVPERAYAIVLWIVSVVFAIFLVGFGNLIIGDLPRVETTITPDQFVESAQNRKVEDELKTVDRRRAEIDDKLAIARLQLQQAQSASKTATETFQAWIQTRTATTDPQQDPEVIERTRQLEQLKSGERSVQSGIDTLENERLSIQQRANALRQQQSDLQSDAYPAYERALFWQELRIFLLRLAITLPLLLLAAWLVVKRRKGNYWPLSRGFVLASVFVFFVELVPYLPSYGGYIRYGAGIIMTFAAGHFLIKNMRHYLERRREVEAQAEEERRKLVSHDEAFKKMAAKVCPGCDRPIANMEGSETNFCVHCGMTLFNHCARCDARKMAFFRFCMACGAPAEEVQ
ncbi:zinc ribbon domain-containing protein [Novosphingobium mangrovi (ex Huang et al. 2023)]|uniref:Zinc ribbon domain-containing protein n=1 Tax=Novosphingobium mangrovi (ex Huang et al. 2023) TaxID=2976432 RepID=A0ABT2I5C5_9SPHN|nr:zinc ribbon domain-containing protein [Novosphingobium mangrovi (ex Huang et al. 2023)]MCT2400000.1 zinc ribbon domain-containing protein [Novosphingobium mangrovi (ex Huang et al. 2023)]